MGSSYSFSATTSPLVSSAAFTPISPGGADSTKGSGGGRGGGSGGGPPSAASRWLASRYFASDSPGRISGMLSSAALEFSAGSARGAISASIEVGRGPTSLGPASLEPPSGAYFES